MQEEEKTKQKLQEAKEQAEQKLQEAKKQAKQEKQQIARNMLALDMDITSIEQITGLSGSEITALKEQS